MTCMDLRSQTPHPAYLAACAAGALDLADVGPRRLPPFFFLALPFALASQSSLSLSSPPAVSATLLASVTHTAL